MLRLSVFSAEVKGVPAGPSDAISEEDPGEQQVAVDKVLDADVGQTDVGQETLDRILYGVAGEIGARDHGVVDIRIREQEGIARQVYQGGLREDEPGTQMIIYW